MKLGRRSVLLGSLASVACAEQEPKKPSEPEAEVLGEPSREGWNDAQIPWRTFEEGMQEASASNKPVALIFFTVWCGHCKNFMHVFEDPRIVRRSRDYVMIRLDKDKNRELSKKYAPDGEYIPRTYILRSDGTLRDDIHAKRDKFKFFYDEKDPADVLSALDRGIQT